MNEEKALIKFNFFDINFTPYKEIENGENSKSIIIKCINKINDERINNRKAIVINRYEGRTDEEPRNIFVSSAAYSHPEKLYKIRMALIRDNKIPTLFNKKDFSLTPLDQLGENAIAETTNFYIDVSNGCPIVCCEFNNNGPRISDIEYYFRHVSSNKMLSISKACRVSIHMKMPINDVLGSIADVLKFRFVSKPNRLAYIYKEVDDSFITNLGALANSINPKKIRVDAVFRERGNVGAKKNLLALSFVKKLLNAIKDDKIQVDEFDDFYLEFEKEDGNVDDFNLIKGKEEILIHCNFKTPGNPDTKDLYDKTCKAFKEYLDARLHNSKLVNCQ